MITASSRIVIDMTAQAWTDYLMADDLIRRSGDEPWHDAAVSWDRMWSEYWITVFLRPPEDF